jgi:hypothetical protein
MIQHEAGGGAAYPGTFSLGKQGSNNPSIAFYSNHYHHPIAY